MKGLSARAIVVPCIPQEKEAGTMTDTILTNIFEDPRWRPIGRRLYSAEIDGRKIGGVLATYNKRYGNYALIRPEMEDRLMTAKREGKIDEAFVIAVMNNGTGRYEFRKAVDAEQLYARLLSKPAIEGSFGPFWALEPYELEDEDAPW